MKSKKLSEILRYLSCSVIITVISWGSYVLFVNKAGMPVFLGNLLSWLIATSASFFVNKLWVFQSFTWKKSAVVKELVTFFSARVVSGIIEIGGVPVLEKFGFDAPFYSLLHKMEVGVQLLYTDGLYSKIGIGIIILILNYVLSKLFVFKNKKDKAESEVIKEVK